MAMTDTTIYYDRMPSPIGELLLLSDGEHLTGLYMQTERSPSPHGVRWRHDPAPLRAAREQLQAYFAGERQTFDLPLAPQGSSFQRGVWAELEKIPFGVTCSYGEIAKRLGQPRASRAVGLANGRNPISIVVPCHRVIGANGTLTGYGGGIERKRWLLRHEGVAVK